MTYAELRGLQHHPQDRQVSEARKTNRRILPGATGLVCGLILFSLLAIVPVQAQVYSGNLALLTQAEVDAFAYAEVTGSLLISGDDDITNLAALSTLTRVGFGARFGALTIRGNAALTSLDGLSGLTSVDDLIIDDNDALTNLDGLSGLTSVATLNIYDNDALTNLDGLSGITSVGEDGDLEIRFNAALTNLDGLSSITSVRGLSIFNNDALTNLDGLSGITSVRGLSISRNDALTNLDGLSGITSVVDLSIEENDALTNLDGLSGITSVGRNLGINSNGALSSCSCGIGALLASSGVMGSITIGNNLPGCNSADEILATTCGTQTAIEDLADLPQHVTLDGNYPNPFNPQTTLRFALPVQQHVRLSVYDLIGREVAVLLDDDLPGGRHEVVFEAAGLPSGLYLARLRADENTLLIQQMLLIK